MTDAEFLEWTAARFVNHHGESPNVDFVRRLRRMANEREALHETLTQASEAAQECGRWITDLQDQTPEASYVSAMVARAAAANGRVRDLLNAALAGKEMIS